MQITDILNQTGGLQSIARELGISETEAASGAAALAPAILGGFQNQVQNQPGGRRGARGPARSARRRGLMDNVVAPQPTDVAPGNQLLGSHLRLQGHQPHGGAERRRADRTPAVDPQEDAADAHDASRRVHGSAGGLARWRGRRDGRWARQHPRWHAGSRRTREAFGGALGGLGGGGTANPTNPDTNNRSGGNPLNDILGMGRQ